MIRRQVWLAAAFCLVACKTPDGGASAVKDVVAGVDDGPFDPKDANDIGDLFMKQENFYAPPGQNIHAPRPVFLKPHGCAKATFTVPDALPIPLRVGVFATPGAHDAWVRISSDTSPKMADQTNNTIGWAVKVLGVPGQKVLAGEESAQTQDFLLQDIDVFFVDTAKDFLEFTNAAFGIPAGASFDGYITAHPVTGQILDAMKKPVANVLTTPFWSTMPYRLGDADFVKYKVSPCTANVPDEAVPPDNGDPKYLRTRLVRDVKALGACFQLQVQVRTGDMPLDKATVEWSETDAPPQTVATINVQPQDITANDDTCENLSFSPWHALAAHQPVGSISKARAIIYKRFADYRRQRNNVPLGEPE